MRRPAVPVLLPAALALLLAGCSSPLGRPSLSTAARASCPAAWHPSSASATQLAGAVARQWWRATDAAAQRLRAANCGLDRKLDQGPELAISSTADAIQHQINRPFQKAPNPIEQLEAVVFRQVRYPPWFPAGVADRVVDQNTGAITRQQETDFLVLVRQSAMARWRAFSETTVNDASLGPFAKDVQGYVAGPTGRLAQVPSAPARRVHHLPPPRQPSERAALRSRRPDHGPDPGPGPPEPHPPNVLDDVLSRVHPSPSGRRRPGHPRGPLARASARGPGNCYNDNDGKMPVYLPPRHWSRVEVDSVMLGYAVVPPGRGPVSLYGDNDLVLSQGFDAC